MRGDIPEAAFNLLTRLPVRTHQKHEPPPPSKLSKVYKAGRIGMQVEINGVVYKSHSDAIRKLRLSHAKINAMIAEGRAVCRGREK